MRLSENKRDKERQKRCNEIQEQSDKIIQFKSLIIISLLIEVTNNRKINVLVLAIYIMLS